LLYQLPTSNESGRIATTAIVGFQLEYRKFSAESIAPSLRLGSNPTYVEVAAYWHVPEIVAYDPDNSTYSSVWVGLDGDNLSDLVQAGTEQDSVDLSFGLKWTSYSAWTELLPNQPTAQSVDLSPNPADYMDVLVWVGNSSGPNLNGTNGCFRLVDVTQQQAVALCTALNGTYYNGKDAEWIVERPTLSGNQLALLSDYDFANIQYPQALIGSDDWISYNQGSNLTQYWIYNSDDTVLSAAYGNGPDDIYFQWDAF
jgi:hypothetical protein